MISPKTKRKPPAALVAMAGDGDVEPARRELGDLASVGPATVADLHFLGVTSVEALATREAGELYRELCRRSGARHDPCCEDVFAAAIAQARDPHLPAEQRRWWYWTAVRKAREKGAIPLAGRERRRARG
jgi:hypothetical protein